MSQKSNPLGLADYGLTDPAILEAATQMAPELFAALHIAHTLDSSHYPLKSDTAIEKALEAVANDGKQFTVPGVQISSKAARDHFPNEFLPIDDRFDLLRKVYLAILINHRESALRTWAKIKDGSYAPAASHPMPTEGF